MDSPQVLIVGSGPAALVIALSLLKNGVPVRIVEKDASHHVGERGPGIMPRTLEIEKFLGVVDEVTNVAGYMPTLHYFDPEDPYRIMKSSQMFEKVDPTPAFPTTTVYQLGQWQHQAIFRKHVEALGGQVELATALVNLHQDEAGVTAELSKNIDGQQITEKTRFSYVIGADGAHSTVRKSLSIDFVGETREANQIYIVDATLEGLEGGNVAYSWGDHRKALATARSTNRPGIFQLLFNGEDLDFGPLKQNKDVSTVQKTLDAITGRNDIRVLSINWQGEWRPNIRMADHFRVGRVFIIGDAAHAHPPTGGQGLNSSVQDAFNLGWKLALTVKDQAAPDLIDSYEKERMPVIAEVLNISGKLLEGFMKESGETQDRDSAWFRGWKLFQLDINYRWSPIAFDERYEIKEPKAAVNAYGVAGHDTRAGDRAPDAPDLVILTGDAKGTKTRLFDLFNPTKHVALVFASSASVKRALALLTPLNRTASNDFRRLLVLPKCDAKDAGLDLSGVEAVVDSEGHAFASYGIQSDGTAPMVVIVRPDAMVGAFALTEAGVENYMKAIFAKV